MIIIYTSQTKNSNLLLITAGNKTFYYHNQHICLYPAGTESDKSLPPEPGQPAQSIQSD